MVFYRMFRISFLGGSQWTTIDDNGALSGLGTVRGPLRDRPCRPAQPKSCPRASSRPSGVFSQPDLVIPSSRSAIPRRSAHTSGAGHAFPALAGAVPELSTQKAAAGSRRRARRRHGRRVPAGPANSPLKNRGPGPSGGKHCATFRRHNFPKASPRSRPFRPQTSGGR